MNFKNIAISSAFSIFILYSIIFLSIFYFFEKEILFENIRNERVIYAIKTSIYAATISTLIATLLAIPSAYAMSRFDFPFKNVIDVFLEFPIIVSPSALGAILLIFFQTPLGNFIQNNIVEFVFMFAGIILAQFITIIGMAVRLIKVAIDEIPIRYENVARTLGASPIQTFFTVTLPLAKKGIISSLILVWAKSIGEFGATITLAGSMPMKTETLPIAIFMKLSTADIKGTVTLVFLLFSISISILIITRVFFRKKNNA